MLNCWDGQDLVPGFPEGASLHPFPSQGVTWSKKSWEFRWFFWFLVFLIPPWWAQNSIPMLSMHLGVSPAVNFGTAAVEQWELCFCLAAMCQIKKCLIRTSFYLVKTSCKIEQLLSHNVRHKQIPGQAGKHSSGFNALRHYKEGSWVSQFIPALWSSIGSASVHPAGSCLCLCPPAGV